MDNQTLLKNSFKQAIRELEKEDIIEEGRRIEKQAGLNTIFFLGCLSGFMVGCVFASIFNL